MKKFKIIVLVLFLVNLNQIKGDSNSDKKTLKHGIQFQISNFLNLSSYHDYTFSYRYNINNNNGLRLGIMLNVGNTNDNGTSFQDTVSSNFKNKTKNNRYKISIQYLRKIITYEKFSMIIGGGPFLLNKSGDGDKLVSEKDHLTNLTYHDDISGYGIDFILGVEYSLIKNVVFSGEYGFTLSQQNAKNNYHTKQIYPNGKNVEIYSSSSESKNFSISNMEVILGISIFF